MNDKSDTNDETVSSDGAFNINQTISAIDWDDKSSVVEAFRLRINGWYFDQLKLWPITGHEAFPVLMTMCGMVNTFAFYFKCSREDVVSEACGVDASIADDIIKLILDPMMERAGCNNSGISGLDTLYVHSGGGIVLDPWKFRDRLQMWFDGKCDSINSDDELYYILYVQLGVSKYKKLAGTIN